MAISQAAVQPQSCTEHFCGVWPRSDIMNLIASSPGRLAIFLIRSIAACECLPINVEQVDAGNGGVAYGFRVSRQARRA